MARRDVDLVIRARDEAKGALDAITRTLEKFTGAQKETQDAAQKTDSQLDRLGASLADLQRNLKGLTAGTAVAQELERARSAVERLSNATQAAAGEAIGYQREALRSARATAELRAEAERVDQAIRQQQAAYSQARTAQRQLTQTTKEVDAAQRRYADAQRRVGRELDTQAATIANYRKEAQALELSIRSTWKPVPELRAKLQQLNATITQAEAKYADLAETQRLIAAESDRAARALEQANTRLGSQAGNVERLESALAGLKTEQAQYANAVKAAVAEQNRLESASDKAAQSLASQDAALERAQANYREVEDVVRETEGALSRLEATARGPLLRAFGQQAAQLKATEQSFRENSTEAQRLARELRETEAPTRELQAAFESYRAAAARGRQEIREQQRVLAELRSILRETGGDVDTFSQRQARFATALERGSRSFREYGTASQAAVAANQRLVRSQQQAASTSDRLTGATQRLSAAKRAGAQNTGLFANAIRQFYGESRTALSFTQRLRSEVLSLIAAYGGFFAVIEGVRGVVNAYQALEAAQNRLNVVFQGDQIAVTDELDFIRRNAERLGIQFGVLAQEYTKFAIATQGTNLEGEETRRIFISVAEAARVNGASMEQLEGTFVALSQIVSKGVFSMEELRQQLGDRLPGAVQILADALDVTTEELFDMIEAGEVSADRLSEFADELDRRFGSQLPDALEKTSAQIGRFQNAVFQAFLTIGEGGAIEGFNRLLRDLTETLSSAQFEDFALRAGAALGTLFDILGSVAQNFDLVIIAVTTFVGLKVAPFVAALVAVMGRLPAIIRLNRIRFNALRGTVIGTTAAMNGAAAATTRFRAALTLLLSSTGVGLLVTLIGTAIGVWVTRTTEATEALNRHEDVLDRVRNAYDETGASVAEWRAQVEGLTLTQARTNLQALQQQLRAAQQEFRDLIPRNIFGGVLNAGGGFFNEVDALFQRFQQGELGVDGFIDALDALNEEYRDLFPVNSRFAEQFDEQARRIRDVATQTADANDVIIALTGTTEEAEAALRRLAGASEETAEAVDTGAERLEQFNDAMEKLGEFVPSVARELERMQDAADLEEAYRSALQLAEGYEEVLAVVNRYNQALTEREREDIFGNASSGGVGASAALLRRFEGFRETPYWDVNAFRVGYGSDTVTLADGTIQRVVEGMRVSVADANRDLIRRIGEFQDVVRGQIGETRFNQFSDEQQAVLTSIAYNYGSLPERILDAVRTGTTEEISAAIRGLQNDNDGVNRERRNLEANIFSANGALSDDALIEAEEERLRLLERQAEERERAQAATQATLEQQQFEIAQQELVNLGQERQAAIQAAIRDARRENADITEQELAQIAEQAGRLFDVQNAERLANVERERALAAEERVNELLSLRTQLQQELTTLLESGGSAEAIENARVALEGVNEQLREAITNALQMLEALQSQDPAIQTAISRMRQLQVTSQVTAQGMVISWAQVERVLADNLANAAMKFAEGLAEGKSVTESLRDAFLQFASDFLRQIAQMILQQLALNAAKAIGRAFGFGVLHTGGVVGSRTAQRRVDPSVFAGAMRYHTGGVAGLRPGEVPTILERGEEVLTRDDPRHIFNGGGKETSAGATMTPRIVNAIDGASFLEEAMKDKRGQETILNYIQANRSSVRGALGV